MRPAILSNILYGAWLLLPVMAFAGLYLGRAPRPWRIKGTLFAGVLAIPAYAGLVCMAAGIAWSPDVFVQKRARASVAIPYYRIDYAQQWGQDFYETYFEVTRQDGLKAYLEIDGDDHKCRRVTTQADGAKVYFLCDEKTISERTPYVDKEQGLLYVGDILCTRAIGDLSFYEYRSNPLTDRETSGDPQLYCRRP
jgi:hypothetical protein